MARRLLDQLPVPWVAVPGNHDIGDNPGASDSLVTERRLQRWQSDIGTDHWRLDLGAWTLLGLNAQLFGSQLEAADAQWDWLAEVMAAHSPERPIVLVLHKPLTASDDELGASPVYRFVPELDRHRLLAMLDDRHVPLVISGHVHQFRTLHDARRQHWWAPTTWAVLPEHAQATLGQKRSGVLMLTLGDDGTSEAEQVRPEGLAQLTLTEDIPDPYHV
jgi:3',5'-cyclic AMP phosphodiesterase CpdA